MGLREAMNNNRAIATMIAGMALLAGTMVTYFRLGGASSVVPTRCFYSTDDGKSFFADSRDNIAPFEKDGLIAVQAHVFTCDGGKTKFVGYLERFTPKGRADMKRLQAEHAEGSTQALNLLRTATEVKSPGKPDSDWVPSADTARSDRVVMVKCPEGHSGSDIEPVFP